MKIIAHMVVRNEIDVVEEIVLEIFRWVDTLVVLDGRSDDGTFSLLCNLAAQYKPDKILSVTSMPDPGGGFSNAVRSTLLELTAPFAPDWVISVDADEIYDSYCDHKRNIVDPVTAIVAAEASGANVVRCFVPQFWLTFADLRNGILLEEDFVGGVQRRLRWYSWGHMGTFIWKWNPAHYYPKSPSKRTPELPDKTWREWQIAGPLIPICRHYCIRSLGQGIKRARERRARGGRRYFGKYYNRFIIDEQLAGLHHLGDDERWCTEPNHKRLTNYMAGIWDRPSRLALPQPQAAGAGEEGLL